MVFGFWFLVFGSGSVWFCLGLIFGFGSDFWFWDWFCLVLAGKSFSIRFDSFLFVSFRFVSFVSIF